MKIEVDVEKCIGAGQCVFSAPLVFDQDDDTGIAVVLDDSPGPDLQPSARWAMSVCPAAAIHITE